MTTLPSFLQDTKDTVSKLREVRFSDKTQLASLDVESLYTNISHELGLKAIKYYLESISVYLHAHNEFVLSLLSFVLTHNFFLFNGKYYHQIRDTAMGTTCAPIFAKLFLRWWESLFVFSEDLVQYPTHIKFWGRYIDDMLIMWEGMESLFHELVATLNTNEVGMHFTSCTFSSLRKKVPKSTVIRCIGTFDANNYKIKRVVDKYWPVLTNDEHVNTPHPSITYRKGRSINDTLVHSFMKNCS